MDQAKADAESAPASPSTAYRESGGLLQWTAKPPAQGQLNLFTGEIELLTDARARVPEELWLFDPDFGLVLPEGLAGKEILVEEGISLQFPALGRLEATSQRRGPKPIFPKPGPRIPNPEPGSLFFGKRPFLPDKPQIAKAADCAQLILSGFGIYLGKKSERLQIKVAGKVAKGADGSAYEFPFFRISEVVIASRGVSISSDLVKEFCERGIRLSFVEPSGRPYAMLSSPILTATVESRREQLLAYNDARGLEFARIVVRGKIRNQRHLLLYCGKYLKQSDPERYSTLVELAQKLRGLEVQARGGKLQESGSGYRVSGEEDDNRRLTPGARSALMGVEGAAGRLYWQGFKTIVESKAEFMGRVHRGADDALNALLNYGYGILYAHVWGAVVNAGLEPFAGFLHVDRPGKPSLVLDLVEEFRQPVVDRTVIAFVNLGQTVEMKEGMLDEESRRALAEKILQRLSSPEPFRGQQFQIRSIIQMQARSLVSFLRGKGKYKPFSFRW
jgi:CRISP-associated protein Cas1